MSKTKSFFLRTFCIFFSDGSEQSKQYSAFCILLYCCAEYMPQLRNLAQYDVKHNIFLYGNVIILLGFRWSQTVGARLIRTVI